MRLHIFYTSLQEELLELNCERIWAKYVIYIGQIKKGCAQAKLTIVNLASSILEGPCY